MNASTARYCWKSERVRIIEFGKYCRFQIADCRFEEHYNLELSAAWDRIMSEVALAFLWHQHQPYYPDDLTGENLMPWVRLHGVKDYCGMALHLLEVPQMRCTINLVPSLLVQLLAYTEKGASDRFRDVPRIHDKDRRHQAAIALLAPFLL